MKVKIKYYLNCMPLVWIIFLNSLTDCLAIKNYQTDKKQYTFLS